MTRVRTIALYPNWAALLFPEKTHSLSVGDEIQLDFGERKLDATVVKLLTKNRVKLEAADGRHYSARGDVLRPSRDQALRAFARRYA